MPFRILVIEDEPANIQTLSTLLKERGHQINIATNGRQALEVLERIRPDLILLDIMMPEMDGFETCRRIKASAPWREIPIIFLTAKTETADIVRGFELGAVDYVAKPFNAHELLAQQFKPRNVGAIMNGLLQFTRRQLHCLHAKIRSNPFDCVRCPLSRGPITGLEQFGDLHRRVRLLRGELAEQFQIQFPVAGDAQQAFGGIEPFHGRYFHIVSARLHHGNAGCVDNRVRGFGNC